MTEKVKPLRIRGEVPDGYEGPVYYRTMEDLHAPWGPRASFTWVEDDARLGRLYNSRSRGRNVLTSGFVVDSDGQLLPEWREPLKARLVKDKIDREEFIVGDPAIRISERMHDAIVSLEPHEHIFIPVDAARPDGLKLRYYLMFIGKACIWDEPVLHPEKNALQQITYISGNVGYDAPSWMKRSSSEKYHFGYLNGRVINSRHLFQGGDDTSSATFFSPELFEKIKKFGDIFPKLYELVPIGIA